MKLSVPRSSAYNLASGTQSGAGAGWRGPRGLGNTSLYDHCPQCRVLATRPHRDIYRPAAALPLPPRSALSTPLVKRDFHRNLERETWTPLVRPLENDARRGKLFFDNDFEKRDRSGMKKSPRFRFSLG